MIAVLENDKKLLSDVEMKDMVSKYIQLKNSLDINEKRNEFFKKIDSLYKTVYLEGESLNKKGECSQCPLEPV